MSTVAAPKPPRDPERVETSEARVPVATTSTPPTPRAASSRGGSQREGQSREGHSRGGSKGDDAQRMSRVKAERDLRRDVFGLVLIAATLMMFISLVTRDPRDPITIPSWPLRLVYTPDVTHYPLNDRVTNACGYWGAYFSSMLIDAIGVSALIVIVAAAFCAFTILGRGQVRAPALRSLGVTIVVVAISTAACLAPLRLDGFPAVGAGGYLGAMGSLFLQEHFALPGAWILTLTGLAIGLLLTTDYVLWYAGVRVLASGAMVSRRGFRTVHQALPRRGWGRVSTDLDAPLGGPAIAIAPGGSAATGQALAANRDPREPMGKEPTIKLRQRPKPNAAIEAAEAAERLAVGQAGVEGGASGEPLEDKGVVAKGADPIAALPQGVQGSQGVQGAGTVHGTPAGAVDLDIENEEDEYPLDGFDSRSPAGGVVGGAAAGPVGDAGATPVNGGSVEPQGGAEPKVRAPKKKDERQAVMDAVNEELPEGVDEYRLPSIELLDEADDISYNDQTAEVRRKAKILEETFRNFGFNIRVVEIETGPVIAQYEVELEAGLRLSKITGLADDLAIALRVPSVRIVAPIPGKNTVGIEVPNEHRQVVTLREVIEECGDSTRRMNIPVFLGKDVAGNPLTIDLAKMPHLLIAGRTGTGKSVCLNAIITSVLMACRPEQVRMLMIDPKMVELSGYGSLPHLMHPVVTDMKKAEAILAWAVDKMEERYSLLAKAGVRHINSYNELGREELYRRLEVEESDAASVPERLPFIVIVADEMADLMMTAGKDVETHIIRLAQKSRAVGIHLILATQKPTVDVITGLIKSNLPARLCFQVASRTDSRVVLDENGADKLLGNGDMLFLWPGTSTLIRGQGTYLSDAEIERVVGHCSTGEQNFVNELMNLKVESNEGEAAPLNAAGLKKRDELYESAIEIVIREGRGSVSLLQRCLGIGYGRAARLIDYMAEDGIVGNYNGSQAREVVITMADWERMQGLGSDGSAGSIGSAGAVGPVAGAAASPPQGAAAAAGMSGTGGSAHAGSGGVASGARPSGSGAGLGGSLKGAIAGGAGSVPGVGGMSGGGMTKPSNRIVMHPEDYEIASNDVDDEDDDEDADLM
jgi:S-DNA-T family DNA segregation ATPase FtsK/SpoIIIE